MLTNSNLQGERRRAPFDPEMVRAYVGACLAQVERARDLAPEIDRLMAEIFGRLGRRAARVALDEIERLVAGLTGV